jgi:hypothetical protein
MAENRMVQSDCNDLMSYGLLRIGNSDVVSAGCNTSHPFVAGNYSFIGFSGDIETYFSKKIQTA